MIDNTYMASFGLKHLCKKLSNKVEHITQFTIQKSLNCSSTVGKQPLRNCLEYLKFDLHNTLNRLLRRGIHSICSVDR